MCAPGWQRGAMAIGASEAVVKLGSEGGAQTTREINQTAGAMTELAGATSGMIGSFNQKPDTSGWSGVGAAMTAAATETSKFAGGMIGLSKSLEDARVELGGFGLALELIPGLGLVEMAVGTWTRREEALRRSLAEKNKELQTTIGLMTAAENAGLDLTESQKELATHTKFVAKEVDAATLKQAKLNVERLKATKVEDTWAGKLAIAAEKMGFGAKAAQLYENATNNLRLETLKATADLEALVEGREDHEAKLRAETAAILMQTRAMQGIRDEHRMAREELEIAGDPSRKYDIEIEDIERVRQHRLASMSARVTDEQEFATAAALINQTAAHKSALAWENESTRIADANKRAAEAAQQQWAGAIGIMTSAVEGFGMTLVQGFKEGGASAADAFKNLADAVVAQTIRMIAKQLVLNALTGGMAGGGGGLLAGFGKLLGFQHGGMVPAPLGQAQQVTVHGGERIVSPTGRGGAPGGGEGGGTTNTFNFNTGVLTAESKREMIRGISRTQGSTGEVAFP